MDTSYFTLILSTLSLDLFHPYRISIWKKSSSYCSWLITNIHDLLLVVGPSYTIVGVCPFVINTWRRAKFTCENHYSFLSWSPFLFNQAITLFRDSHMLILKYTPQINFILDCQWSSISSPATHFLYIFNVTHISFIQLYKYYYIMNIIINHAHDLRKQVGSVSYANQLCHPPRTPVSAWYHEILTNS
jgi:hypothetical protein